MREMSKLVAVDVAILPPPEIMARAIAYSAALPGGGAERLQLDAQHLPHITLTQQFVKHDDLEGVFAEIDDVLEHQTPLHLRVTGAGQSAQTLWLTVERTPQLLDLHEQLMKALKGLERIGADAHAFFEGMARVGDVHWVSGFRQQSSFGAFTPHITLGHGSRPPAVAPIEFEATAIAACHLGRFCTCRKVLRAWELKRGNEPVRADLPDID